MSMAVKAPTRDDSERAHDIHTTMYHLRRGTSRKRSRVPFLGVEQSDRFNSAVAGALSGIACALSVAPLDVVKARKQVQGMMGAQSGSSTNFRYRGTFESLRLIYKEEGFPGFFRGLPPTLLGYVPSWSIYFTFYGLLKDQMIGDYGKEYAVPCTVASAVIAGSVTNAFTNPFWVVRTRLQVQDHVMRSPEYRGTFDAFVKIYRNEGVTAFYRGLGASLLGLTHVAIQFPLYEELKKRFMDLHQDSSMVDIVETEEGPLENVEINTNDKSDWKRIGVLIASSTLSKIVATVLTYPHDIARARLHIEKKPVKEHPMAKQNPLLRISVFRMIFTIYEREGFLGLYQGLGTQLVRVTPACAITFTSFELLYSYLTSVSQI